VTVFPRALTIAVLAGFIATGAGCQDPCADTTEPCFEVDGGRYLAFPPAGTSSTDSMPSLVFFHGWSSSAKTYANKRWLRDEASRRGYLLILPDGKNNTWAHRGSPSSARDELRFMDAVMTDADQRWHLSSDRVVSGFSQGGSMAWDLACYRGDQYAAFFPASGAFWEPLPDSCDTPVHLRHTHGTADTTIPMEGRLIGRFAQGDVHAGMARWRSVNGCTDEPDATETVGPSTCQVWRSCESGRELSLCLHSGKHRLPSGFLPDSLDWAEQR
jgi:polyhydroxybutyrate depolymerase